MMGRQEVDNQLVKDLRAGKMRLVTTAWEGMWIRIWQELSKSIK
jgi:hypothetical protein